MKEFIIEKPLKKIDYILFGALAVICYLTFQQGDIMHTAGCSYGYLQGHFLDFYDWDANMYNMWPSYMPATYIVFAIWNIPMKLFGIVTHPEQFADFWVIMWYKLLPVCLYLASGFLVFKIANIIGMGGKKAKLCAYAFLTMPIGFFSQFLFGQYDILTVFFVLLGIYFYFKDNRGLFILYFALAIPFKYTPLLIFIPLLLLKEKNIWKLIWNVVLVAVPYLVQFLIYFRSPVFQECVLGFNAVGYVTNSSINTGAANISLVILSWGLICAWAYFKNVNTQTEWAEWTFYFCTLVIVVIFGLSQWHPQWLLFAVPFWVISAFMHRDTKIFMVIDLLLMLFFVIYTVNMWPDHVDQELFSWGIFGDYIYKYIGTKLTMREIFVLTDMDMVGTVFTALMVVAAVFKHPSYCLKNLATSADDCIGWLRGRFYGGLAIFLVPAFACFAVAAMPPYASLNTGNADIVMPALIQTQMSQTFQPEQNVLEVIEFKTATYGRENKVSMEVNLVELETGNLIYTTELDCLEFKDNSWVTVEIGRIPVKTDKKYRIDFTCYEGDGNNCISLYRTKDDTAKENTYAIVNGERQNYSLCVRVYGTMD